MNYESRMIRSVVFIGVIFISCGVSGCKSICNYSESRAIEKAMCSGDINNIRTVVNESNANKNLYNGYTALHIASARGDVDAVKHVLEMGGGAERILKLIRAAPLCCCQ